MWINPADCFGVNCVIVSDGASVEIEEAAVNAVGVQKNRSTWELIKTMAKTVKYVDGLQSMHQ